MMNDHAKLNFFASAPESCSYLDNRKAVSAFANPHVDMDMSTYNELIQRGFRRSGRYVYRPHCPNCQACISVRLPVRQYQFSRSERRVIRHNDDIEITAVRGKYRDEHFDLYRRYIDHRHDDGSMANPVKADYHRFLICDWIDTLFLEFRQDRKLIAVAVTDIMSTALSAVYTFFDPDFSHRSLGHFAILSQIQKAQSSDLEYLYLGYWIKDCNKMNYKRRYHPLEGYIDGQWQPFDNE